ncbi:MAG: ABC transporter substrate-binding protein [Fibrobacteraceae bacterium]|nr:ABC transporter substrate-binding protein [Fibrobacteraceae bacterium]
MLKKFSLCFLGLVALFLAWRVLLYDGSSKDNVADKVLFHPAMRLKYAENFGLDSCEGYSILWVKDGKSGILRWVLADSSFKKKGKLPFALSSFPVLHIPAKRIAVLSSTYLGYLLRLDVADKVIAVDSKKYIADSSFYYFADSVGVREIGEGMELSPEAVYALNADMIFAFSMGESIYDAYPKLARLNLPVVLTSEWSERTPLAKAEWIKFFGLLTGRSFLADSLFSQSETRYIELRNALDSIAEKDRPSVFTGVPSSGTWYASPGKSYMSSLIADGGGSYLWASDTSRATFSMPFEKAFSDARDADVWLNPGGVTSLKELAGRDARVKLLKAWEKGKIFEYDLKKGPLGGIDFYEGAVVEPDLLLKDIANVLHPDLFKKMEPLWYRKLSNL